MIDLTSSFTNIIGQLQGKGNVSLANIQTLVDCMKGFLQDIGDFCTAKVAKLLCSLTVDPSTGVAKACVNEIKALPSFLQPMAPGYKREHYLKESGFLAAPAELVLRTRNKSHYVSASGCHTASVVQDTMQYIPLDLLLGTILAVPGYEQKFKQQVSCSKLRDAEIVDSFVRSKAYQEHPFFVKHPNSLALNLYVDSFETINVLGSHTGIHKMEGLYMCILNLPSELQSKLDNIFLVAFGMHKMLNVIEKFLRKLLKPFSSGNPIME